MPYYPPVRRVTDAELRRLYRDGGYEDLVERGQINATIEFDRPASPRANQAPGTRSQLLAYSDSSGRVVMRVHRYLRPDGTLGGSGRADPKYILHEGTIYKQAGRQAEGQT